MSQLGHMIFIFTYTADHVYAFPDFLHGTNTYAEYVATNMCKLAMHNSLYAKKAIDKIHLANDYVYVLYDN